MGRLRIGSFNLQNLRLRGAHLDGARDRDIPADMAPGANRLDGADRALTAAVIRALDADILACQEVFDAASLTAFHDRHLAPIGAHYPHRACLPGNDGQGLDVAILSRTPLARITSHAGETPQSLGITTNLPPDRPLFRRDCLEVDTAGLTLFIVHLKAPYPDKAATWATRRAEAQGIRALIERRFARPATNNWMILGDLNQPAEQNPAAAPILPPFAHDLLMRLPPQDRWTWADPPGLRRGHPDALLISPALAAANPTALPEIHRQGLPLCANANPPHLHGVGRHRPHASDHAGVVVTLDI